MKTTEKPKSKPSTTSIAAQKTATVAKVTTPRSIANKSVEKKVAATSNTSKVKAEKHSKKDKQKKIKMVRDSFTMPENDYAKLAELKKKCLDAGIHVKKSELLRAGLLSLSRLSDASLLKEVGLVEIIKTGRPAKA